MITKVTQARAACRYAGIRYETVSALLYVALLSSDMFLVKISYTVKTKSTIIFKDFDMSIK